jgi:hypothetical protein
MIQYLALRKYVLSRSPTINRENTSLRKQSHLFPFVIRSFECRKHPRLPLKFWTFQDAQNQWFPTCGPLPPGGCGFIRRGSRICLASQLVLLLQPALGFLCSNTARQVIIRKSVKHCPNQTYSPAAHVNCSYSDGSDRAGNSEHRLFACCT